MKRLKIVLYGGGGVAIDAARYIQDINEILGHNASIVISDLIDENNGRIEELTELVGYSINAHSEFSTIENPEQKRFVVTLGHSPIRHQIFTDLKNKGMQFYSIVHPRADISANAKIGKGCIIAPFSLINAYSTVGDNVLINVRSTVGHDSIIEDSCILSPHAVISGAVTCGVSVFLGAGAIVNPGLTIGEYSKLTSGAVVSSNIDAGCFAYGNPAAAKKIFDSKTGHSIFAQQT